MIIHEDALLCKGRLQGLVNPRAVLWQTLTVFDPPCHGLSDRKRLLWEDA